MSWVEWAINKSGKLQGSIMDCPVDDYVVTIWSESVSTHSEKDVAVKVEINENKHTVTVETLNYDHLKIVEETVMAMKERPLCCFVSD